MYNVICCYFCGCNVQDHSGLNREQAEALTQHLTDLLLYQTQFTKDNFVTKEQLYRLNIQVHIS